MRSRRRYGPRVRVLAAVFALLTVTGCGAGSGAASTGVSTVASTASTSVAASRGGAEQHGAEPGPTTSGPHAPATTPPPAAAAPVTVVAAGDIACAPGRPTTTELCRYLETSDLALGLKPDAVAALGDLQYEQGAAAAFAQSYAPTWGRLRAITRPAVGNHEYGTAGARAYFDYFGASAGERGKGWYSYDLGAWHVVVLNSNCTIVRCTAGSAQLTWLRADLAAHPARCTLAYWHHPRWSDGEHGDDRAVAPFLDALYAAGADVILTGHDHDYERFAPMDPAGRPDPARGLRAFVVGTGGKSHYATTRRATTDAVTSKTFGVLALTLQPHGYAWRFVPIIANSFADSGSASCH